MDATSIGSAANLVSFQQLTGSGSPAAPRTASHHGRDGAPQADDATATLRYRRTERTGLYIVTQEGDVVRLRIKVRDALDAATSTGTDEGTNVGQVAVD